MATIFDIDFSKFSVRMLPPDKRMPNTIAFTNILLSPLQWVRDLWFGSYRTGSTASLYADGNTYPKYARVIFNKQVFESLINNNIDLPTVTTSWMLVQKDFLGLQERVLYNGQKIVLEYALNKFLNTNFRQPPLVSDVYINNLAPVPAGFRVGNTIGSTVGNTKSSDDVGLPVPFSTPNNFNINIPAAVYAGISDKAIRQFVNKYIPISLNFTITTY